jgi:hypothetical protein
MRGNTSDAEPGPNGTTILIGFCGQSSAAAMDPGADSANDMTRSSRLRITNSSIRDRTIFNGSA